MTKFWWIPLSAGFAAFYVWIFLGATYPISSIVLFTLVLAVLISNIGAFWMWYIAIRWEKRPVPFLLLGFLPFSFLWYYFQRYRIGAHKARSI